MRTCDHNYYTVKVGAGAIEDLEVEQSYYPSAERESCANLLDGRITKLLFIEACYKQKGL